MQNLWENPMGKGHKRFGWKYPSASRAGNTIYNPFPEAMTTLFPLSWHQRFQWEFSLCPCQASSAWSLQPGADARLPSCPSPLGQPSGWLHGMVKLFGPGPGRNNSSGKLFAPPAPSQVAWRSGAKTQQTEFNQLRLEIETRPCWMPRQSTERAAWAGVHTGLEEVSYLSLGLQHLHMTLPKFISISLEGGK